jgi:hypothetical protein
VGATEIFPLHVEEIFALVSDVYGDVYPSQVDDVLAHHVVVGHALLAYTTVLPCRFGTLAATELEAVALLRARYSLLESHLRFLEDTVEMCIRALIPGTPQAPDLWCHEPQWQSFTQGTRYLAQKRLQHQRFQALQAQANTLIQSFQAVTFPFLSAIKTEQHSLETGLLTTLHCLVQQPYSELFKQRYEHWRHGHRHVQFLYTGPWPPYTFAAFDLRDPESRPVTSTTDQQFGL